MRFTHLQPRPALILTTLLATVPAHAATTSPAPRATGSATEHNDPAPGTEAAVDHQSPDPSTVNGNRRCAVSVFSYHATIVRDERMLLEHIRALYPTVGRGIQ